MELKPLSEQVMVVFGASSGIGRVTAIRAVERGALVVAAARGVVALSTLAGDASRPDRLAVVTAEAADPEQVRAVADRAVERFGRIDTWAHVAGVGDRFMEALRVELRHENAPVSVTEILPGKIATPFFEHARTRLGVRPSGPPPVYAPERVADAILRAAENPTRDAVVGGAAQLQLALQRLSPRLMDVLTRAAIPFERSRELKGPDGGDALDRPVEGDDRERGVVTTLHR